MSGNVANQVSDSNAEFAAPYEPNNAGFGQKYKPNLKPADMLAK